MSELNKSIIRIKNELLNDSSLKMTGSGQNNTFYQLSDFMAKLYKLMAKEEVNDNFKIVDNKVILEFIKGDEKQTTIIPYTEYEGPKFMQKIQYQGALITYYRRYVYNAALGLPNNEIIDQMPVEGEKTEEQLTLMAAKEFTIACVTRGKDAKYSKTLAKEMGLGAKSTKEEWMVGITKLDSVIKAFDEGF